jgi:hypothetical protein
MRWQGTGVLGTNKKRSRTLRFFHGDSRSVVVLAVTVFMDMTVLDLFGARRAN